MHTSERFTSVRGFAEVAGLSERTLWSLIERDELPVYRVGRRTLVKLSEGIRAIERLGRRGQGPHR